MGTSRETFRGCPGPIQQLSGASRSFSERVSGFSINKNTKDYKGNDFMEITTAWNQCAMVICVLLYGHIKIRSRDHLKLTVSVSSVFVISVTPMGQEVSVISMDDKVAGTADTPAVCGYSRDGRACSTASGV